MIEQGDAEQSRALPEPAGEDEILLARCGIARGGLWAQIQATAFIRINGLNTSRGCTMAKVREPIDTTFTPMMLCLASSPQTRNCSRSSPAKSGLRIAAAVAEVVNGDEGGTARFSRTSVTRYRGTAYSFLGFGCRIPFNMPCEL